MHDDISGFKVEPVACRSCPKVEELKSEMNLWKTENSNAQYSIGIHLDRIISLEKELERAQLLLVADGDSAAAVLSAQVDDLSIALKPEPKMRRFPKEAAG